MPKNKTKISPLEWEIMTVIWDQNKPISVREVLDLKYPNGEKAYTTVQTVMNKLEKKGFLTITKIGLVNFYKPTKKKIKIVQSETLSFVKRVYDGSYLSLINFLIDSESLSKEELENLKNLIKLKEKEKKGK